MLPDTLSSPPIRLSKVIRSIRSQAIPHSRNIRSPRRRIHRKTATDKAATRSQPDTRAETILPLIRRTNKKRTMREALTNKPKRA